MNEPASGRPRILVLVHSAARIGPPVVMASHLRWLLDNVAVDLDVVLHADGPLAPAFRSLCPALVVLDDPLHGDDEDRAAAREVLARLPPPDLIVVNTAWSAQMLDLLPRWDAPVATLVHELETGLSTHVGARDRDLMLSRSDLLVAGGDAIAANLLRHHHVRPDRLVTVAEHVEPPGPAPPEHQLTQHRDALGATAGQPLVVAAGTADWRKAPDLFVHTAAHLARSHPTVRLTWIGASELEPAADGALDAARADRARLGLTATVGFHAPVPDLRPWIAAADVFLLTSREDGFPLVCLEAAAAGVPIVCFDTGGAEDLVGAGAGTVVAYPDVAGLAAAVGALLDDDGARSTCGERGRAEVAARYSTPGAASALWGHLLALVGPRDGAALEDGQADQGRTDQ